MYKRIIDSFPQRWKIDREFRRAAGKFTGIFGWLGAPFLQKMRDRSHPPKVFTGQRPRLDDLIVLLLFPARGVPQTTLDQLEFLERQGVAAIVVSNLPLGPVDKAHILERSHLLIERENHGYDFGGYRAGILELLKRGYKPRNLFVMNDSVWFPLSEGCDLIHRARNHPSDLFGIYYNERPKQRHRSHLQSYFYRFGPKLCSSEAFSEYWQSMVTYDNKDLTIRRNEMRLTNWFVQRGFTVGYIFDLRKLQEALASLSVPDRYVVAKYLALVGDKHAAHLRQRVAERAYDDDALFREDVERGVYGRYFLSAHPGVLLGRLGCPVLKKDRQDPYRVQRALVIANGYTNDMREALVQELRSLADDDLIMAGGDHFGTL